MRWASNDANLRPSVRQGIEPPLELLGEANGEHEPSVSIWIHKSSEPQCCKGSTERDQLQGRVSKDLVAVARKALAVDKALVKIADERVRGARNGARVSTVSELHY